ncbi:ATP-binding protein [Enterococcus raffinosus]|uniref:AAA family ATPase n=1 Tax=Enterococcus TaxID=1350 RepID=UPI00210BBA3F|nr:MULTISPECIES: AAA family ATPase [Enterococcus]UXC25999.1 ATP-binding protein [Enterococcus raffinosus]
MYTLIFKVDNEDIVLIDEPEISIHVSWQRKFIDDLEKTLHDKKDTRVIIATHSVQIVDDNWDSVIDMGAVEK